MRNSTSTISSTHIWSSPIPYLFGGLGLMLLLIAVALVILACSYRKRSSLTQAEAYSGPVKPAIQLLDMEPRIVVIMAGDEKPSFIATPVSVAAAAQPQGCCCCDKV